MARSSQHYRRLSRMLAASHALELLRRDGAAWGRGDRSSSKHCQRRLADLYKAPAFSSSELPFQIVMLLAEEIGVRS